MSDADRKAVIVGAARLPTGRFLGGLSSLTAPQLGAEVDIGYVPQMNRRTVGRGANHDLLQVLHRLRRALSKWAWPAHSISGNKMPIDSAINSAV